MRDHIRLNYYNLFWIFIICSILGLVGETLFCYLQTGRIHSRAGLVWGPFSPIYGSCAVFMTIVLNRIRNRHLPVIILTSMLIGMAFEFLVSLLLERCFGLQSWDYSGTFMNIGGRTNLFFGIIWGVAG
ncbi:MAG: putative ABC transporter permease, partial [Coriobacteriales bacterium]|nr:putative ABC transporter permease [Coriobacteriales bacterium]